MGVRRYSARQLATALKVHIRTIQRECNRGHLEAYRTPSGHYHLIDEPALISWMASENAKAVLARSLHYSRRRKSHGPATGVPREYSAADPNKPPDKDE